jgi:predicted DNA-binding transcriptional regulator AlpA
MSAFSELKLVTKADAAEIFRVSVKTIDNYIKNGKLPKPVPFASKEYWHSDDFKAFLEVTFKTSALTGLPSDRDGGDSGVAGQVPTGHGARDDGPISAAAQVHDRTLPARQRVRQSAVLKRLNTVG